MVYYTNPFQYISQAKVVQRNFICLQRNSREVFYLTRIIYRKSSNNSPGAYLPTKKFWVGAYSSGGAYLNGGLINLEE